MEQRVVQPGRGRPEDAAVTGGSDVARATLSGLAVAAVLVTGIWFGSRGLRDFDTALVPYAGASVFCAFGLGYSRSPCWG